MKVLILCSHRYYAPYTDYVAPFIYEQMQNLKPLGCEFQVCFVRGGGLMSYLRALRSLKRHIDAFRPDLIHAHYGLCCLVANMQRRIPVVSTFHGSDINSPYVRPLSKIAMRLSAYNIFVSRALMDKAKGQSGKSAVVPCAVDTQSFRPMDRLACRRELGLSEDTAYVLFSKEFADKVKNAPLAQAVVQQLPQEKKVLLEFFGYTRRQVPLLYNAVDAALLTSFSEGSPQFVKEAVACGCPVVSTDVGDVREVMAGVPNARICSYRPEDVLSKLQEVMSIGHLPHTCLPECYTSQHVAKQIYTIYQTLCK